RGERGAFRGPAIAQLGRSGGGSSASVRPTTVRPSTAPPASPGTPSAPAPQSRLGSPALQAPAIAPLSPQQQTPFNTNSGAPGGNPGDTTGQRPPGDPREKAHQYAGGRGQDPRGVQGLLEKAPPHKKGRMAKSLQAHHRENPDGALGRSNAPYAHGSPAEGLA